MSKINFHLSDAQSKLSWISSVWYAGRHFEQAIGNQTTFFGRIYHSLVGIIDLIPIAGRLASFAEKYFVENFYRREESQSLENRRVTQGNSTNRTQEQNPQTHQELALVSEARIDQLANKHQSKTVYANNTRLNFITSQERGGLFMYYDVGYPGYGREENGKICLITGSRRGFDFPCVRIDLEDLTQPERKYFIKELEKTERTNNMFASVYGINHRINPETQVQLNLLEKLRALT